MLPSPFSTKESLLQFRSLERAQNIVLARRMISGRVYSYGVSMRGPVSVLLDAHMETRVGPLRPPSWAPTRPWPVAGKWARRAESGCRSSQFAHGPLTTADSRELLRLRRRQCPPRPHTCSLFLFPLALPNTTWLTKRPSEAHFYYSDVLQKPHSTLPLSTTPPTTTLTPSNHQPP